MINMAVLRLRAFFSYYGSKHRIIRRYPKPMHGRIVEPFCGSAAYATAYHWLPVQLYDANPKVVAVWEYLIRASSAEIRALPARIEGDIASLSVPQEARWLIGFWMARARAHPARNASAWATRYADARFWCESVRDGVAAAVQHIRHWRIALSDYAQLTDYGEADWFVDPPYQGKAGLQYRAYGSRQIDYLRLGSWCRERRGQVIVCEGEGAAWLPFIPLCPNNGLKGVKTEMVWVHPEPQPLYVGFGL